MTAMDNTLAASAATAIRFDNGFVREMPGFYLRTPPAAAPAPRMLRFNRRLAVDLGLDADALDSVAGAELLSGARLPDGADAVALAYAGHQFGGFSPQLGDGRAHLLGEVVDRAGRRFDIQLKGSGRTPFSRGGDGKAALGPVLREYLISDAMHALGVPTTRALAAVATGDLVYRETPLPGAVLTRVASSHLRIGTFQFFAARGETEKVRRLADYAIVRHYPEVAQGADQHLRFFESVLERQAALVAHWMAVGFIHGVMNTDNMAIAGETIDYGPCAFMNAYDPGTVFSSIDTHGRYAYANQPRIAQWNLARLAETLLPLIDPDQDRAVEKASAVLDTFPARYNAHWTARMRAKLGLFTAEQGDADLAAGFLVAMQRGRADFTNTFRALARAATGDEAAARDLFIDPSAFDEWAPAWRARLAREPEAGRAGRMNAANPAFIPRNHRVEEALAAAHEGDLGPFDALHAVLLRPYDEQPGSERYTEPQWDDASYRTFCGT